MEHVAKESWLLNAIFAKKSSLKDGSLINILRGHAKLN
jgi:hypothetical protein